MSLSHSESVVGSLSSLRSLGSVTSVVSLASVGSLGSSILDASLTSLPSVAEPPSRREPHPLRGVVERTEKSIKYKERARKPPGEGPSITDHL